MPVFACVKKMLILPTSPLFALAFGSTQPPTPVLAPVLRMRALSLHQSADLLADKAERVGSVDVGHLQYFPTSEDVE